jgi:hypothetical protein
LRLDKLNVPALTTSMLRMKKANQPRKPPQWMQDQ